jgi:hypothetical protein
LVDEDVAKAAGECLVLFPVEFLVAEEDHAMFVQRGADFGDDRVVEIVGDVGPENLGAAPSGDGLHLDPAVAHAGLLVRREVRSGQ